MPHQISTPTATNQVPTAPPPDSIHAEPRRGIDPSNLIDDYAHERVAFHVGRIGRQFRMSEHRRNDLRQDFYLALTKAARRYDPMRASIRTFASRVIELTAAFCRRCIRNERRCPCRSAVAFSQLPRRLRDFAPSAPRACEPSSRDIVVDTEHSLAQLTHRQRTTAEALKTLTAAEIAQARRRHPSTVYREIASLRLALADCGLAPAH